MSSLETSSLFRYRWPEDQDWQYTDDPDLRRRINDQWQSPIVEENDTQEAQIRWKERRGNRKQKVVRLTRQEQQNQEVRYMMSEFSEPVTVDHLIQIKIAQDERIPIKTITSGIEGAFIPASGSLWDLDEVVWIGMGETTTGNSAALWILRDHATSQQVIDSRKERCQRILNKIERIRKAYLNISDLERYVDSIKK